MCIVDILTMCFQKKGFIECMGIVDILPMFFQKICSRFLACMDMGVILVMFFKRMISIQCFTRSAGSKLPNQTYRRTPQK